jgi:HrpA-like RNA helicase
VFEKISKRKVILSTNIAESSITIDDTYYVIDFCLVKELKFNVKTNHETLELNWASKASCQQVITHINIYNILLK